MYNTFKTKILPILWSLALLLVVFITVIDFYAFRKPYYEHMYELNGTAESLAISESDLTKATDGLLDYLRDDRDNLDISVTIAGEEVAMYNEREISHMVDVKDLYQGAILVRNVSLVVLVITTAWLFLSGLSYSLVNGFTKTISTVGFILGLVVFYALLDFNGFWNAFHKVFFSNDLWLLDPRVDRLITMVPLNFFSGMVTRIVVTIVIVLSVIYGGLATWRKHQK